MCAPLAKKHGVTPEQAYRSCVSARPSKLAPYKTRILAMHEQGAGATEIASVLAPEVRASRAGVSAAIKRWTAG
jgi:hypothetical protein